MDKHFNSQRLRLARSRRQKTSQGLANAVGISPVTLSRLENNTNRPEPETIAVLAKELGYPVEFFYGEDLDEVDKDGASFRSLKAMTAKERNGALAAASLAFVVADKIDSTFGLPPTDVPNLSYESDAASAAATLRAHWGLGDRPIGNMIDLLEAKGVRVYSLTERTVKVDAFSCWRDGVPYVFLNTLKSAERSRFDAAHELGHLCLHQHGGANHRSAEPEANNFGSHFLMPPADIKAKIKRISSLSQIQSAKKRWGVSLAALTYHLSKLGILTEWQARSYFIQMNKDGSRTTEPDPMPIETSFIWQSVFRELWKDGITKSQIAKELFIPDDEFESLVFGLAAQAFDPDAEITQGKYKGLRLVSQNNNIA